MLILLGIGPAADNECSRSVIHAGGIACGYVSIRFESWWQFIQGFDGGITANAFVLGDACFTCAGFDRNRNDFGLEFVVVSRLCCKLVAAKGKLIHFISTNFKLLTDKFGSTAHTPIT